MTIHPPSGADQNSQFVDANHDRLRMLLRRHLHETA